MDEKRKGKRRTVRFLPIARMSFRKEDEDRENDNSSSSGLGLGLAAAAVMGVGIGAALYCFFNKRTENPTAEGSTTRGWTCSSTDTLMKPEDSPRISNDSYITVSEQTTTDTSMFEDSLSWKCSENDSESDTSGEENSCWETENSQSDIVGETDSESDDSNVTMDSDSSDSHDSVLSDWDVTASLHSPSYEFQTHRDYLENYARNWFNSRQKDKSRERSWTLEECSICFEVILRDQEIMALPCTHNFHTKCILPWLQERQTCPNCRKSV